MKRFGVIVIIVVALAAVIVGYNKYVKDDTTKKTETTNQTNKQTDPTEGGKYLVIKEWGVRLSTTALIRNSYYTFKPADTSQAETVEIFSQDFDKVANSEGGSCRGELLLYLSRYKKGTVLVESPVVERQYHIEIDGYVYTGDIPRQAPPVCSGISGGFSLDEQVMTRFQEYREEYEKALHTLQGVDR